MVTNVTKIMREAHRSNANKVQLFNINDCFIHELIVSCDMSILYCHLLAHIWHEKLRRRFDLKEMRFDLQSKNFKIEIENKVTSF